jgi:glyoxylase-like metal-dependent hydrolase (beta-lactamase superfamily II)
MNSLLPHIYWMLPDATTDRPILGVVSGKEASLLVDAGNSPAHARLLLSELAKLRITPPKWVALTHWHWDHIFGLHTLDLPAFSSFDTRCKIEEQAGLDWSDEALDQRVEVGSEIAFCRDNIKRELPDRVGLILQTPEIAYESQVEVNLGGVTCQMVNVGGDHDAGSSVIFVPESRFLFLGDCLAEDYYHGVPKYRVEKLFPLIDRLLAFDAEWFLESHSDHPLSRKRMLEETAFLKTIGNEVDRLNGDREAVLASLPRLTGRSQDSDMAEIASAFIAGRL